MYLACNGDYQLAVKGGKTIGRALEVERIEGKQELAELNVGGFFYEE